MWTTSWRSATVVWWRWCMRNIPCGRFPSSQQSTHLPWRLYYIVRLFKVRTERPKFTGFRKSWISVSDLSAERKQNDHISDVLKELNWLSASQLAQYHRADVVRKDISLELPENLHAIITAAGYKWALKATTTSCDSQAPEIVMPFSIKGWPTPTETDFLEKNSDLIPTDKIQRQKWTEIAFQLFYIRNSTHL